MKNFKIIALIMLAGTLLFSSCAKDEDDIATPSIAFSNGNTELTFNGTNSVDVTIDVTAEGKVSDFVLVKKIKDATGTSENPITTDFDFDGETSGSFRFQRTAAEITADITLSTDDPKKVEYIFTLTDKEGSVKTATYTVKMEANQGTPLSMEKTNGIIWNLIGSEMGAWDLVADMGKASSDASADKDMINTTTLGSTAPETFENEWEAGNATMFVKVTDAYATIVTEEMAKEKYDVGTPVAKVSNVATGDIYIAKIRGNEAYTVLEVTNVVVTDNNNEDKIEFKYKKK